MISAASRTTGLGCEISTDSGFGHKLIFEASVKLKLMEGSVVSQICPVVHIAGISTIKLKP